LRCVGVVRQAPEQYIQTLGDPATHALSEEARQAFSRLYAHFVEYGFHCAHAVLEQLRSTDSVKQEFLDAVSGLMGGTVFTGRTCSALTAGVVAWGAARGTIEHSRLRVLRMIGLMAIGGEDNELWAPTLEMVRGGIR
jgi:hypothetical protein